MQSSNQIDAISIIGVASGLGQKLLGLESAPQILRQHGLVEALSEKIKNISDLGDIHPSIEPHPKSDSIFWDLVYRTRNIATEVLSKNELLLTLGGDHSIAIATVQASLNTNPNTRVVWVDAHGDINTPATSLTGHLHGMPLAALLGLFKTPLEFKKLQPQNLLLVGVRDLDPAEIHFLEDLNIEVITSKQCNQHPEQTLAQINLWFTKSKDSPIHLSFDIDALDPEFAPATGLRVNNGLSMDFSKNMMKQISLTQKLTAIDFVEFNPLQAKSNVELLQTIESAKEIIAHALFVQGAL